MRWGLESRLHTREDHVYRRVEWQSRLVETQGRGWCIARAGSAHTGLVMYQGRRTRVTHGSGCWARMSYFGSLQARVSYELVACGRALGRVGRIQIMSQNVWVSLKCTDAVVLPCSKVCRRPWAAAAQLALPARQATVVVALRVAVPAAKQTVRTTSSARRQAV